jgi:hypothetical protein
MPWQFIHYHRRPFQSLFFGMEHHLIEAKELYTIIHSWDATKPEECDQDIWMKEKTAARASFIMGVTGIEAFTNNILKDFGLLSKSQIPFESLNKYQRKNDIDFWRLIDKVYFLPSLCQLEFKPPDNYFNRTSKEFLLFEELVNIRNSIVHGKPDPGLRLVKLNPNKKHELIDDLDINWWPLSKIIKDFTAFNYDCAKTARDNIVWVKDSLTQFIDTIDNNYLNNEKFEPASAIIEGDESLREDLLLNWRKYTGPDKQLASPHLLDSI